MNCFWKELPGEDSPPVFENDDSAGTPSEEATFEDLVVSLATNQTYADNLLSCQLARLASCLPVIWSSQSETTSNATLPHTTVR